MYHLQKGSFSKDSIKGHWLYPCFSDLCNQSLDKDIDTLVDSLFDDTEGTTQACKYDILCEISRIAESICTKGWIFDSPRKPICKISI